jgi:hypothetical protein
MKILPAEASIVEVSMANIDHHPQAICFINPKHPSTKRRSNGSRSSTNTD